jgi:hypothetical protein
MQGAGERDDASDPTAPAPPSGTLAELEKAARGLLCTYNRWVAATEGDGPVGEEGYTLSLEYEEELRVLSAAAHAHAEAGESASLAALLSLAHAAGRAEERERVVGLVGRWLEAKTAAYHVENGPGWRGHLTSYQEGYTDALDWAAQIVESGTEPPTGGKEGG